MDCSSYSFCLSSGKFTQHPPSGIKLNALSEVDLELQEPMDMALSIMENRKEHFILVDPRSNQTVGAGTLINALG